MNTPESLRLPARTESEVRARYLGILRRAISCIHPSVQPRIGVAPRAGSAFRSLFWTQPIEVTSQRAGAVRLEFDQLLEFGDHTQFAGEKKYSTRSYVYRVSNQSRREPFVYWHWNPTDVKWPYPHVHADMTGDPGGKGLRLHIPTGQRVTIEQVIGFVIREGYAEPIREDRQQILADGQRRYDAFSRRL